MFHLYNRRELAQSCQQEHGFCFLTSQFSAEENNEKDRELGNMNEGTEAAHFKEQHAMGEEPQ